MERQRQYQEKERQLQSKRKQEEIERWWAGAEFFKPKSSSQPEQVFDDDAIVNPTDKIRARYNFDYSRQSFRIKMFRRDFKTFPFLC